MSNQPDYDTLTSQNQLIFTLNIVHNKNLKMKIFKYLYTLVHIINFADSGYLQQQDEPQQL